MTPVSGSLIMHLAIASTVGIAWALVSGPLLGIRRPEARSLLFGGALLAPVVAMVVHLAVEHGYGKSHIGPYHFACLTGSWLGDAALLVAATALFTVAAQAAVAWWALHWLIREAVPAETYWSGDASGLDNSAQALETLREVSLSVGVKAPLLLLTPRPGILCVAGVLQPVILMSHDVCQALDSGEMAAVLAHEVAHVRRRDNAAGAVAAMLRALVFFSPAAHIALNRYRAERERAADEIAVRATGNGLALASGIIKVWKAGASRRVPGSAAGWSPATAGLASGTGTAAGTGLPGRVRQLMVADQRPADRWRFGLVFSVAVMIALVFVLC